MGPDQILSYNLARLLVRLLSRSTYTPPNRIWTAGGSRAALPLNWFENMFGYFEVNPVKTIPLTREGIKLLVGSFGLWFGTPAGEQLRSWAAGRGWPLAWAYNPMVASMCLTGPQPPPKGCSRANKTTTQRDAIAVRLLDPAVLPKVPEGYNITHVAGFASAAAHFDAVWTAAGAISPTSFADREARIGELWVKLLGGGVAVLEALGVEPLYAHACADSACVGVKVSDGSCVCGRGRR